MTFPKKTYKKVSESWYPESILAPWIRNMSRMARRESLVISHYILSFGVDKFPKHESALRHIFS